MTEDRIPHPLEARAPRRRAILSLCLGLSLALLLWYALALSASMVLLPRAPHLALLIGQLVGLAAPSLAAIAWFLRLGLLPPARSAMEPSRWWVVVALASAGFVVAWSLGAIWMMGLDATGWAWVKAAEDLVTRSYGPLLVARTPWEAVRLVAAVCLVPALCEELAFRGCLQRLLRSRYAPTFAIALTAFLFSAFHGDPLGFPSRLFLGVSLGLVYERTGSLLASGVAHAIQNGIALALVAATGALQDPSLLLQSVPPGTSVAPLVLLLALGVASWIGLLRWLPPRAAVPLPPSDPAPEAAA